MILPFFVASVGLSAANITLGGKCSSQMSAWFDFVLHSKSRLTWFFFQKLFHMFSSVRFMNLWLNDRVAQRLKRRLTETSTPSIISRSIALITFNDGRKSSARFQWPADHFVRPIVSVLKVNESEVFEAAMVEWEQLELVAAAASSGQQRVIPLQTNRKSQKTKRRFDDAQPIVACWTASDRTSVHIMLFSVEKNHTVAPVSLDLPSSFDDKLVFIPNYTFLFINSFYSYSPLIDVCRWSGSIITSSWCNIMLIFNMI